MDGRERVYRMVNFAHLLGRVPDKLEESRCYRVQGRMRKRIAGERLVAQDGKGGVE